MMDVPTRLILAFAVSHKSEVDGVSNRMELHGVKKVLSFMRPIAAIESATIDKHASVMKYLRESGIPVHLDLWHLLGLLTKGIRAASKPFTDKEDRQLLLTLKRRLFTHIWSGRSFATQEPDYFKEFIFYFFLHVIGLHEWPRDSKFVDLFQVEPSTKLGKGFFNSCASRR
jgi:hypothetical protein